MTPLEARLQSLLGNQEPRLWKMPEPSLEAGAMWPLQV